ncbi:unnamed protein product [Brassicogethes aeneus]|uniref:Uncharacterized protein n=1 Tax=Brassicogethes aeneus TaxID=1431903 RepID=A0A9P0F8N2_BRAAE|nr:unnamed protein product [Brassicogethes aeneus]
MNEQENMFLNEGHLYFQHYALPVPKVFREMDWCSRMAGKISRFNATLYFFWCHLKTPAYKTPENIRKLKQRIIQECRQTTLETLRNDKHGGAWCPRQMVSRDAKEFLEISLEEMTVITGCRTQGRYGNGQGQEYAEEYMVEYWRPGFSKWARWKNRLGKEFRLNRLLEKGVNKLSGSRSLQLRVRNCLLCLICRQGDTV